MQRSTGVFFLVLVALAIYRCDRSPDERSNSGQSAAISGGYLEIDISGRTVTIPLVYAGTVSRYQDPTSSRSWAFSDVAPTVICGKTAVALGIINGHYLALNGRTSQERRRSRLVDGAGQTRPFIGTSDDRDLRNSGIILPEASDSDIGATMGRMLDVALATPGCR